MYQGILRIQGSLERKQFWPEGRSDADTANIKVDVTANAFTFQKTSAIPPRVTHAFEGAKVSTKYGPEVIINNGKIRVRLQGIDAPELHLGADAAIAKANRTADQATRFKQYDKEYRQPMAETATKVLLDLLKQTGQLVIPCEVITAVDKPGQAVDSNGRLVADIYVTINGQRIHLNAWLVEHGWAFPLFYNSMSDDEIQVLLQAAQSAAGVGVWKRWKKSNKVNTFNMNLVYDGDRDTPILADEAGPVIMPKLFRRTVTWKVNKLSRMVSVGFYDYLKSKKEECWQVSDFLADRHSAPTHYLYEFVNPSGTVKTRSDALVFKEEDSTLKDANKKPITTWW